MKQTLIALACGLTLALSASTAQALTIGDADPRYLGEVDPATPSNPESEILYINQLISMAPNATVIGPNGNLFDRSDNSCNNAAELDACPNAVLAGSSTGNAPSGSVNVTGWTWLYVKYGGDAHVWYVGDLTGVQAVPLNNTGGQGMSHYDLFNPSTPPPPIPDGGATLGLLGLGMLGLGYLRRRKQQ